MRTKDARNIRAGIVYAKQVIHNERTNRDEPAWDTVTAFGLAYWHTYNKWAQKHPPKANSVIGFEAVNVPPLSRTYLTKSSG